MREEGKVKDVAVGRQRRRSLYSRRGMAVAELEFVKVRVQNQNWILKKNERHRDPQRANASY